jgi:hypothetical protein
VSKHEQNEGANIERTRRNGGLTLSVVLEVESSQNLTTVLGGVLHRGHAHSQLLCAVREREGGDNNSQANTTKPSYYTSVIRQHGNSRNTSAAWFSITPP